MSDMDNKKVSDGGHETDRLAEKDDYQFITETIKEKPWNKKMVMKKGLALLGAGLVFGIAAAGAFALVLPHAQAYLGTSEETPKVNIPADQPEETGTPAPTPTPEETPEATPTPSPTPQLQKVGLEEYENIYQEVLKVAEEPRKALVTVSGMTDQESILSNTTLSGGQSVGIIIVDNGSDLYILTEKKATDQAAKILVTLSDGSIVEGRLQKGDSRTGLAVVLVAKEQIAPESLEEISVAVLGNSYSLIQGKPVIAIGSPAGYHDSVSFGTITSVGTRVSVTDAEYNLLTTDILGSDLSSGVLLDVNGEVIGIIAQSYGNTGGKSTNMVKGLAVSQLKPMIEILSNGEDIRYLGVKGQDVTEILSKATGIPQGVYVDEVEEDSPAMRSGLQSGDVIVEMNGEAVPTVQKYSSLLQQYGNGQKAELTVMRAKGAEGYSAMEVQMIVKVI